MMVKADWVSSGAVCQKLGISVKHLTRLREEGLLKEGRHWRNIARPQAARPTYRYHCKLVEKALEIPAELRG
jgi:predicted ArsR family transcriptional regulator